MNTPKIEEGERKKMNIIDTLKKFTSREDIAISSIAISDGIAYATDGRIAFATKLDEPHEDEVPKGYPIVKLKGIFAGVKKLSPWSTIDPEALNALDKPFKKHMHNVIVDRDNYYNRRYDEMSCPCCGETLYWDKWDEELVSEREEKPHIDANDVMYAIRIVFDNKESVYVNFYYLRMIWSAFGNDLLFAAGNEYGKKTLLVKSKDGTTNGILLEVRIPRMGGPNHTLEAKAK